MTLPIEAETPTDVEILSSTPLAAPAQEFPPPENNVVKEFDVAARKGSSARHHEAELMTKFENFLLARGHKVGRLWLVPASSARLLTDTFDSTSSVLYEVKASSTRNMVRFAIGHLGRRGALESPRMGGTRQASARLLVHGGRLCRLKARFRLTLDVLVRHVCPGQGPHSNSSSRSLVRGSVLRRARLMAPQIWRVAGGRRGRLQVTSRSPYRSR